MRRIKAKFPSRSQALPVFSTILFIVFSWMFYQFFIQVPSWIFYMNASKLLVMFSYVASYSLAESLIMLGFLVLLCLIYPARYFKEKFISQGTAQVLLISLITYFIRQKIEMFQKFEILTLAAIPLVALAIILVSIILFSKLLDRFASAARILSLVADRMTIFAYIYLPLGVAGFLVVVIRNIV